MKGAGSGVGACTGGVHSAYGVIIAEHALSACTWSYRGKMHSMHKCMWGSCTLHVSTMFCQYRKVGYREKLRKIKIHDTYKKIIQQSD